MYKALIIDDEPLACGLVEEYLEPFTTIETVGSCNDGFEGLKQIQELQPDLIFLDVQMPKITGFELLEILDQPPAVIFTTAFDEYALKAFEANAVDYLLKPFAQERFNKAVQKFLEQPGQLREKSEMLQEQAGLPGQQERMVVKDGAKINIIPLAEVLHLQADGDYVKIHTQRGNFMKKKTLTHYEQALPAKQFVRVHRSHLINVSHITRIDPYGKNDHVARLQNQEQIPVSRSGYQKLKELLSL